MLKSAFGKAKSMLLQAASYLPITHVIHLKEFKENLSKIGDSVMSYEEDFKVKLLFTACTEIELD
jgi:hypothetical protein